MTKKDMRIKYEAKLELELEDIEWYKQEVMNTIEYYCTSDEINASTFSELFHLTVSRTVEAETEFLIRDWTLYQKAKREAMLIKEILQDLK